jgi:CheY-like chemotaxis protein
METAPQRNHALSDCPAADILLVEDDFADAQLTIRALKRCGFAHRVEHVSDGPEALEYIAALGPLAHKHSVSWPKLILLDLGLHKMGGLHVLRQLKADERTRGIPVIVLTSSKIAIEVLESYKLGVNSYVLKPTDGKKFDEVVAEIGHYWLAVNETAPL